MWLPLGVLKKIHGAVQGDGSLHGVHEGVDGGVRVAQEDDGGGLVYPGRGAPPPSTRPPPPRLALEPAIPKYARGSPYA